VKKLRIFAASAVDAFHSLDKCIEIGAATDSVGSIKHAPSTDEREVDRP
jgi:hypothetical protein